MFNTSKELQAALKNDERRFDFEEISFSVGDGRKLFNFEKAFQIAKQVYGKTGHAIIRYKAGHGVTEIGKDGVWYI